MSKFIKCCLCGTEIEPNDANMCIQCLGSQVFRRALVLKSFFQIYPFFFFFFFVFVFVAFLLPSLFVVASLVGGTHVLCSPPRARSLISAKSFKTRDNSWLFVYLFVFALIFACAYRLNVIALVYASAGSANDGRHGNNDGFWSKYEISYLLFFRLFIRHLEHSCVFYIYHSDYST